MVHHIQIQWLMMINLIVRKVNDKITKYLKENHFENDIFLEEFDLKKNK